MEGLELQEEQKVKREVKMSAEVMEDGLQTKQQQNIFFGSMLEKHFHGIQHSSLASRMRSLLMMPYWLYYTSSLLPRWCSSSGSI